MPSRGGKPEASFDALNGIQRLSVSKVDDMCKVTYHAASTSGTVPDGKLPFSDDGVDAITPALGVQLLAVLEEIDDAPASAVLGVAAIAVHGIIIAVHGVIDGHL